PANGAVYTTGRLTSDMVLKCARIGIPIIMSRTAPSSLGLAIAKRAGATLIGYARPSRLNVFNGAQRIIL
ncbi:MAG: formate dehydrogenase accessory sulfurtransferase FdhD, partial [Desulfopila sp.]|nr:formate dehydrogenase accessory sulfurtransferase FdhD [Desulfopila sp.]